MPTVECGFPDAQNRPGSARLVQYGLTLEVRVGFDPHYRPSSNPVPSLSSDRIPALVDTGATESCIDSILADRLYLPFVGEQRFSGISGSSRRRMHLAQIFVPGLQWVIYGRFAAVDLISGGQPHAVLLGRTFLRGFRMIYEGRSGRVIIENESSVVPTARPM